MIYFFRFRSGSQYCEEVGMVVNQGTLVESFLVKQNYSMRTDHGLISGGFDKEIFVADIDITSSDLDQDPVDLDIRIAAFPKISKDLKKTLLGVEPDLDF